MAKLYQKFRAPLVLKRLKEMVANDQAACLVTNGRWTPGTVIPNASFGSCAIDWKIMPVMNSQKCLDLGFEWTHLVCIYNGLSQTSLFWTWRSAVGAWKKCFRCSRQRLETGKTAALQPRFTPVVCSSGLRSVTPVR